MPQNSSERPPNISITAENACNVPNALMALFKKKFHDYMWPLKLCWNAPVVPQNEIPKSIKLPINVRDYSKYI